MRKFIVALVAVFSLAVSAPSLAETKLFTYSDTSIGTFSWELDASPIPTSFDAFSFLIDGVANSPDGVLSPFVFFTSDIGGGFGQGGVISFISDQVFSGSTEFPIFENGTYAGTNATFAGAVDGTLIIQTVTAVPEPETYAMLIAGLGLLGFMARRRKQQAA